MNNKIQLLHPTGKHAVQIDREKYDILRNALVNILQSGVELTHTEIVHAVNQDFRKNNVVFEGSVEWYLESVKLDLEARNEIKRSIGKSPVRFFIP